MSKSSSICNTHSRQRHEHMSPRIHERLRHSCIQRSLYLQVHVYTVQPRLTPGLTPGAVSAVY